MGISLLTALTIATRDDLVYGHAGPSVDGKYSGRIALPNGRALLSTEPIFDTPRLAENHMIGLRDACAKHFDA